ncbi:hypothetical protein Sa4125_03350 [Aureimonas sp. SA4125]|uniref:DUF29 domain-containing protein n=1 Tax=Aureimonas sp. SA4125 TaxID=2826993 RepID=UPI001CC5A393|nr:DUF29 domain-containing protein [Aureimonas sp. SA4125]BDA82793.1 hypothetical protein Sa4125_03350 [Aureimonas sp. SA4125]
MSLAKDKPNSPKSSTYEDDVYAWACEQAQLLRLRRFDEVDLANVIEEIESVGRAERKGLKSSYRLVIVHLLKWQLQPQRRSRSWFNTIGRERDGIENDENDSASLAAQAVDIVTEVYSSARRQAARETGLPLSALPATCPYSLDFLRDHDAMPE